MAFLLQSRTQLIQAETMKLLTPGASNAKLIKSDLKNDQVLSFILYLAPADTVEGINTCAMAAIAECRNACLYESGRAAIFKTIPAARIRKTEFFRDDIQAFMDQLVKDCGAAARKAAKHGKRASIRLNGTSDIVWENVAIDSQGGRNIFEIFPDVIWYDYTKLPTRKARADYHLTVSYSEANTAYAIKAANTGHNLAVVFRDTLPEFFTMANGETLPVINGDAHDSRFLDNAEHAALISKYGRVIVGLKAKGPAKRDNTGFVIDAARADVLALAA